MVAESTRVWVCCDIMSNHPNRGNPYAVPMTSEEFRSLRLQLGLTQSELGKIMAIAQKHISRIETGERQPTCQQAAFIRYIYANRRPLNEGAG